MNNRAPVLILGVACLGLGLAFITIKNKADKKHVEDTAVIGTYSNKFNKAFADLDEQRNVTALLEKDVETQKKTLGELTNNFSRVSADLARTETALQTSKQQLQTSQEEIKQRDTRIADLETQNQALDKKAADLSLQLTNLTTQIADTQRKLAASEGDKNFLQNQLKRLMADKSELERQFSDLTVLRAQVAKIKEDIAVAKRLEWSRQGLYASSDQKGAQRLMQVINPPPTKAPRGNYDLNVEVSADGSIRVIPPRTNAVPNSSGPASR